MRAGRLGSPPTPGPRFPAVLLPFFWGLSRRIGGDSTRGFYGGKKTTECVGGGVFFDGRIGGLSLRGLRLGHAKACSGPQYATGNCQQLRQILSRQTVGSGGVLRQIGGSCPRCIG